MTSIQTATILIPAYNPDGKLVALIDKLCERFRDILVVNDGSAGCEAVFEAVEAKGAHVISHETNRGKGAALKTGFRWIIEHLPSCSAVVTADADGQHRPDDIKRVAAAALANPSSLTLGVRSFSGKVPFRSRFGNWWTRFFFFVATGLKIKDTQTGLRAIPASLLRRMLEIDGDRYEYEMAMLADAKNHPSPPVQIPIETIYIEDNASSHFNPLRDSICIYSALLKFCVSSIGCFLLDNIVFTALLYVAGYVTDWKRATCVLAAIIAARLVSATTNYACNRNLVFRSSEAKSVSFAKYWILVAAILSLGYLFTATLSRIVDAHGITITILKIIVETALFFLSYKIQKSWVFGASRPSKAR